MRKFLIGIGAAAIVLSVFAWLYLIKEPVVFTPAWRVGQKWKVQVFARRPGADQPSLYHNIWRFQIADKKAVAGQVVYTIEADEERKQTGVGYRFELIHPSLVLKSLSVYRNGKLERTEEPATAVFFLDPQEASLIPMDFSPMPIFRLIRAEQQKPLTIESAEVFPEIIQRAALTQEIIADQRGRKLTIATTKYLESGGRIENVQLWDESRPWWSGARRVRNGVKESEAILIQW